MEIVTRLISDVAILDLRGKLTIGEGDVALREELLKALDEGSKKVLLNLKGVSYMDSAGLGELIRCKATCTNRGVQVRLIRVPKRLLDILTTVELTSAFDMYDDEETAIESFE